MQHTNTQITSSLSATGGSKKILDYVLFFVALFIISLLVQSDLTASNNLNQPNYVTNPKGTYDFTFANALQKVVWREDIYDPAIKGHVNVIKIDENYFTKVTEPEKAVLGYLASTIGNECYADGSKQNVKCKILTALNLGYQCSESNKSFLKNWFRDDATIVNQIENCLPTLPSTIEKTFEEVKISTTENTINVELKGLKLNIKENTSSNWSESISFKVDGDKVSLVERTKK